VVESEADAGLEAGGEERPSQPVTGGWINADTAHITLSLKRYVNNGSTDIN